MTFLSLGVQSTTVLQPLPNSFSEVKLRPFQAIIVPSNPFFNQRRHYLQKSIAGKCCTRSLTGTFSSSLPTGSQSHKKISEQIDYSLPKPTNQIGLQQSRNFLNLVIFRVTTLVLIFFTILAPCQLTNTFSPFHSQLRANTIFSYRHPHFYIFRSRDSLNLRISNSKTNH